MKIRKSLLCLLVAVIAPAVSRAGVIFTAGNNPQPGEENVLLNDATTGSTVSGTLNQSGLIVNFSSATQTLTEPANGQARVEATNNSSQVALSDIFFGLANGTFGDAVFNMFIGGTIGTAGATATITAVANDGNFQFTTTLGNGQNFLTVVATGGEVLESISIAYPDGFTDLRQPRISGATSTTVPDAGTTLPLLGASTLALALLKRLLN